MSLLAVAGLVASFHAIIYAYGRNIFSLSRAGYLPQWLSRTGRGRQTPYAALLVGAVVGYGIALLIEFGNEWLGGVPVAGVLLNMAVFGAVISYVMQMAAFIQLRRRFPGMERPYVSPLGTAGAMAAGVIALVALVFLLLNADYRVGIYGCALWFGLGLLWFGLVGRRRLVKSPEEEFALRLEMEAGSGGRV